MAEGLYTRAILKLAMSLTPDDHLHDCDGSANMRASVCGSEIKLQIALNDDGAIDAFAIAAKACAMGQASAAVLKKYAKGLNALQAQAYFAALSAFLHGEAELPQDWPELNELRAAKDYPARHPAILLPYRALLAAFEDARTRQAA